MTKLSINDDATQDAPKNGAIVPGAQSRAASLDPADVASMLYWLTLAADDEINLALPVRQRKLLAGMAEMVRAAAWVWLAGVTSPEGQSEPIVFTILDGGWENDDERMEFFRAIGHSAQELMNGVFGQIAQWPKAPLTCSSDECISILGWRPRADCSTWVDAGFKHVLASVCTLDAKSYSGVLFYRRLKEPPFGARERAIVHAMFQQVDWMHRSVVKAAAMVSATDISPREREVLMRLLAGESRKTIAATLHLSLHTVADHLKQIYRKLGVKTRAGLMAQFIQGPLKPPHRGIEI